MYYDWKIQCLEVENVYTHTWMAYIRFHNYRIHPCQLVVQMAFRAEVAFRVEVPSAKVEVHQFHCASSSFAYSLLCHFGMEGSRPNDFYKPLLDDFLLQPSPVYAQWTQLLASSLLGLSPEVSYLVVTFSRLLCAKTLLWLFSTYLREGAWWTLPAAPDLLA